MKFWHVIVFSSVGYIVLMAIAIYIGWFGFFADIITVLSLPIILVAFWQLWKQINELRRPKIVSEDCLEFSTGKTAINLVPLQTLAFLPRIGETVFLPGEGAKYGEGLYHVENLEYLFSPISRPEQPSQAELKKVVAKVTRT